MNQISIKCLLVATGTYMNVQWKKTMENTGITTGQWKSIILDTYCTGYSTGNKFRRKSVLCRIMFNLFHSYDITIGALGKSLKT